MNLAGMMKQAQQMQKKLQDAQESLSNQEITSTTGNGAVTATVTGQGHFKGIKLSKSAINPENPESVDDETVEMLEDLILAAVNTALKQCEETEKSEMQSIAGGMNLPF